MHVHACPNPTCMNAEPACSPAPRLHACASVRGRAAIGGRAPGAGDGAVREPLRARRRQPPGVAGAPGARRPWQGAPALRMRRLCSERGHAACVRMVHAPDLGNQPLRRRPWLLDVASRCGIH